jgi:ABC-type uncharacterized transport system permease subunit
MITFAAAGLLAHSVYLWVRLREQLPAGAPLASWHDWCLMSAWVLVGAYLGLTLRRPQNSVGLFLLPLVLGLIGLAVLVQGAAPFPRQQALSFWRLIHGLALLIGTAGVTLGFATGVMFLVQSYRLKHKLPPRQGFKLPSLEWLQRFNREALFFSTFLLGIGLVSGLVLNLARHINQSATVAWTDPGVLLSAVLFVWLAGASLFEALYKPARQGRKVAYLTVASFVFLAVVLAFVFLGEHAMGKN